MDAWVLHWHTSTTHTILWKVKSVKLHTKLVLRLMGTKPSLTSECIES